MIFGQLKFTVGMYKKFLVLVKKIRSIPIEELIDEFDYFEQNLEFLGITAVQDELQPNVGQTLVSLKESGIKIWVLTGD